MQLVVFSKALQDRSVEELARLGGEWGVDGFDLAVRPGHPVNPDNMSQALPEAASLLAESGLAIPMVTAGTDMLRPEQPGARELLAAMAEARIGRLKLGYFKFDPVTQDYWIEVDRVRKILSGWERLGREYGVRVCYHTHSNRCMGLNAGLLMHLLKGIDPEAIGAYIDTGHLCAEGEEFAIAAAVVKPYLSMVAVKDVLLQRIDRKGHGAVRRSVVEAGRGMVDWTAVFNDLKRLDFRGPVSIHCEFEATGHELIPAMKREAAFFRELRRRIYWADLAGAAMQP